MSIVFATNVYKDEAVDVLIRNRAAHIGQEPFCEIGDPIRREIIKKREKIKRALVWNNLLGLRQPKNLLRKFKRRRTRTVVWWLACVPHRSLGFVSPWQSSECSFHITLVWLVCAIQIHLTHTPAHYFHRSTIPAANIGFYSGGGNLNGEND